MSIKKAPKGHITTKSGSNFTKQKKKIEFLLEALLIKGKAGLNKIEALRMYGETCLNTEISKLSNKFGIQFKRKLEPYIHQHGGTTHLMRYTLVDETTIERVIKLLKNYRDKRTPSTVKSGVIL
jgi:hypothetical protein